MKDSVDTIIELGHLAKRINAHHENAMAYAVDAKATGYEAVKEAILCGHALKEAKATVGHGGWLAWFEKHCSQIAVETARRWMRLANQSHVTDLESCPTLRQAYIAVGILPEPEANEGQPAQPKPITFDLVVRSVRRILPAPVLEWPQEERAQLVEELKPLVELYQQLTGQPPG